MADSKIRVVLVSHGEQSKGMLNTVQMLLGEQTKYCCIFFISRADN